MSANRIAAKRWFSEGKANVLSEDSFGVLSAKLQKGKGKKKGNNFSPKEKIQKNVKLSMIKLSQLKLLFVLRLFLGINSTFIPLLF